MGHQPPPARADALTAHAPVAPFAAEVIHNGASVTVRLEGEADGSTHAALRSALSEVDLSKARTVVLRLSAVEFCDVGSGRDLIEFAWSARSQGATVRISDRPNVYVRTLLRILDVGGDLPLE